MSRREFQFSDGSSHKFWAIEVDGKSQTVQYGRVGTSGQTQTKVFGSDDEAKKASDKLIAEKIKKGYAEVAAGSNKPGVVSAKQATPKPKQTKNATPEPAEKVEKEPANEQAVARVEPTVTRVIELDEADWQVVTWRPRTQLKRPPEPPYDFEACRERLRTFPKSTHGGVKWQNSQISPILSRREAHFWFLALTKNDDKLSPQEIADKMREKDVTGEMDLELARKKLKSQQHIAPTLALRSLFNLFEGPEIVTLLQDREVMGKTWDLTTVALNEFTQIVFPYLSSSVFSSIIDSLRPAIDINNWPTDLYQRPPMAFFLAALIGMPNELLEVVRGLKNDLYLQSRWDHSYYHQTQRIVFGLGSPDLVDQEMRRLKLQIRKPEFLRSWLALTEFTGLDYARDNILAEPRREDCEALLKVFTLVKAPEVAPHMLELKLSAKAPALARQWLEEQVGNGIAGLIPTATGRGKLAEAALDYLRDAKKKGHENFIRDCLKNATREVAESIHKNVLDFAEKEYQLLDAKAMPAELKAAFEAKAKKGKLPVWSDVTALPPLIVGEKRLSDEHVTVVLEALQRSTLDLVDPVVSILKEHADAASLDAFAWKVFQLWQSEGAPSKEKWAMAAVGLLGGDVSALKLTPLVRNWPGESQHQRAVFGLECLRAIGSDTALMQLNGIAQKIKFKGLKQKAADAMEAIATDKGLTRSQLEDRIVPDCDLDERGSRVFDFGPRQFRFVLGPEMKPMLKDADGKVKTDLPKPGVKDDASKANEAVNAWKLMKKQIKEVANIQAQRLEQAMVTGRRWPVADFETLLVKHPLMTNLVRLILWGGYDKKGQLTTTFRVTEDQTYADVKDGECTLKGIDGVGIVHPLHLGEEQRSAWGEIFSDYEIVPPFHQLGRAIYRLEKNEEKESEIKRFEGVKLFAPTLVFGLEKLGWVRGLAMDAGCFDEHSKPFPSTGVTAVVTYEGTVGMGYISPTEVLTVEKCYFVEGNRGPSGFVHKEQGLKLGAVDPVAVSEVLTDLTALAAKGK